MAEARDFDKSRFKSMGAVNYKIKSYPTKDGTNGILTHRQVDVALSQAFSKWQAVSAFSFVALGEREPDLVPDIFIEFGDFVEIAAKYPQLNVAQAAQNAKNDGSLATTLSPMQSSQEITTKPILMIFDDSRYWTVAAADTKAGVAIVEVIRRTIESSFHTANDLLTVAVHEIGHALGLGHNSDPNSIMQPKLGAWDTTLVYYMTNRPLPDVDARALETRYKAVDLPYDGTHFESVIAGSTFQQTDVSSRIPRVDVEPWCWGVRENTPTVPLMHGYCYNSALRATGYGYWMLHLLPRGETLVGREWVVGGGILRRTEPGVAGTLEGRLDSPQEIPGYAPVPVAQWGSQTGQIQLAARAQAWNPSLSEDADSIMYFVIGREAGLPKVRFRNFYTVIGDAYFHVEGRYSARTWGSVKSPTLENMVAEARTYAIEKEGGPQINNYENAISQTYISYMLDSN